MYAHLSIKPWSFRAGLGHDPKAPATAFRAPKSHKLRTALLLTAAALIPTRGEPHRLFTFGRGAIIMVQDAFDTVEKRNDCDALKPTDYSLSDLKHPWNSARKVLGDTFTGAMCVAGQMHSDPVIQRQPEKVR